MGTDLELIGKQFGPYRIEEVLARGGQGIVARATHAGVKGADVALKVLIDDDRRAVKRFRQEGKVLAKLEHPNLPRVFGLGQHDGKPYLAMELVPGEDLEAVVEREGVPDPDWSVRILGNVARTLHYCHERGLVHRDLKPANVLIERGTGRPLVADFGLVKRDPNRIRLDSLDSESLASYSGEIKGTPNYMALEQVDTEAEETARTDVYALGATLFFLLTGKAPYSGHTPYHALMKMVQGEAPDPREERAGVPDALAELCMLTMNKDPERRPASADEFARRLERAARGEPWSARAASRGPWVLLAVGVVAFVVGLVVLFGVQPEGREPVAESPVPGQYLLDAQAAVQAGEFERAESILNAALVRGDQPVEALFKRGEVRVVGGHYPEAIEDMTGVLRQDPGRVEAFYWRGKARQWSGDDAGARADLRTFCEAAPNHRHAGEARRSLQALGF